MVSISCRNCVEKLVVSLTACETHPPLSHLSKMYLSMLAALFFLASSPVSVLAHGAGGHHHHHDHDGHDHHGHSHSHGGGGSGDHKDWGSSIAWKPTLEEGIAESASTGKPLFVLIHKSWCGACNALRPKFAASTEIASEASNLVMVQLADDEEPKDALYKPGGAAYIPRIMFFHPSGKLMEEVTSGNAQYAYFYGEPQGIVSAMQKAVTLVASEKFVAGEYEKGGDL